MTERIPAEDIFFAALERSPADRAAFLAASCGSDADLRARIEKMLAAQPDLGGFLAQLPDRTAGPPPSPAPGLPSWEGAVIAGRYKLLQEVGEGGMGSVWMAEQREPVRRRVAVKLIRAEYGRSADILVRFEAERQAIALMDHPHIAKLLDAGTTGPAEAAAVGAGRPYFVMELVKGVPLDRYCDEHRLSVPDRLRLFVQVCSAVQHAHQKGVIHRDLKPSNILVESHDGRPVPKVIDFGLAKAAGGARLTEHTLFTRLGTVAGTPQYMAPEQATFNALDVDTRADVYALGVILYELLTGTTPLTRETIRQAQVEEMLRLIREQDAQPPSSRLSGSDSTPSVAANRQSEPARLGRLVRGDLDWVVLKALAKERDLRYESAAGFAGDVERFLNHEPVLAGPPGAGYRLRKFVRRNRVQVVATGLVLAALVAGIVGTTAGLIAARRESRAKEAARQAEADQRVLAEGRLAKMEAGVNILGAVFADIDPAAEKRGGDPLPVAIGKQLERAADGLKGDAVGDPLVVARLQGILGRSLAGVGRHDKAIEVLEPAAATRARLLGDDHPDTLLLRLSVAAAYLQLGKVGRAISMYEAAVPALARQLPATDRGVLRARGQYANALVAGRQADKAIPLLTALVDDFAVAGRAEDQAALVARNVLAHAYLTVGDFTTAIAVLEALVPDCERLLGVDHPDTLVPLGNLASAYGLASQFDRALGLQRRAYVAIQAKHGDDHPYTLVARNNLGLATMDAGQFREAVAIFEQLLQVRETRDGPASSAALVVRGRLGTAYSRAGQPDRAAAVLEVALTHLIANRPPDAPELSTARSRLALAYAAAGQFTRAVPLLEAAYASDLRRPGQNPIDLIVCRSNLAYVLDESGQFARAVTLHEANLREAEAKLPPDHLVTLQALNHLGMMYRRLGRTGEAIPLLQRATDRATAKFGEADSNTLVYRLNLLAARREAGEVTAARAGLEALIEPAEKVLGSSHPTTLVVVHNLAEAQELEKDWARALAGRRRVVDAERRRGATGPALSLALTRLGRSLLAAGQPAAAEPPLREALASRERTEADLWGTALTRATLGAALAGQKKYTEAEPLLLEGYRGLQARAELIPFGTLRPVPWSREQLVQLYEAWGKPDEAAKWRAEPATPPPAKPSPE